MMNIREIKIELIITFLSASVICLGCKKENSSVGEVKVKVSDMGVLDSGTINKMIRSSAKAIGNNKPQEAIVILQKVLAADSLRATPYNNLGVAYIMTGRYQEAVTACSTAVVRRDTFQLARNNLKWAVAERDEYLRWQNTSVEFRDINFYISFGLYYFRKNRFIKAREVWSQALKLDSENVVVLNNLAILAIQEKKYDEALKLLKKANLISPDNYLVVNNMAWAKSCK